MDNVVKIILLNVQWDLNERNWVVSGNKTFLINIIIIP